MHSLHDKLWGMTTPEARGAAAQAIGYETEKQTPDTFTRLLVMSAWKEAASGKEFPDSLQIPISTYAELLDLHYTSQQHGISVEAGRDILTDAIIARGRLTPRFSLWLDNRDAILYFIQKAEETGETVKLERSLVTSIMPDGSLWSGEQLPGSPAAAEFDQTQSNNALFRIGLLTHCHAIPRPPSVPEDVLQLLLPQKPTDRMPYAPAVATIDNDNTWFVFRTKQTPFFSTLFEMNDYMLPSDQDPIAELKDFASHYHLAIYKGETASSNPTITRFL